MILGVAAAGVGASVVAGAEPASATEGNPVLLGESNKASETTLITNKKGTALAGFTSEAGQSGVLGADTSSGGFGVQGTSNNGVGVAGYTSAHNQYGVEGVDTSSEGGYGVYGTSSSGTAIYGSRGGEFEFGVAVMGEATCESGAGVWGEATAADGIGVKGIATGENGAGVYGFATGTGAQSYGVYASSENSDSLYVDGNAAVTGTLSKGGGSFKIDHPLDPGGKYLCHSFVESPEMMNVYNGTVTLDGKGQATVQLPEWFEALNRDYRYQLTALLSAAPNLHVSALVADGKFSVAGGNAGQQVSWQVTGIRQDAWANANRIPVEVDKNAEDRGRFLHPELFGGEAITALAKARTRAHRGQHPNPA